MLTLDKLYLLSDPGYVKQFTLHWGVKDTSNLSYRDATLLLTLDMLQALANTTGSSALGLVRPEFEAYAAQLQQFVETRRFVPAFVELLDNEFVVWRYAGTAVCRSMSSGDEVRPEQPPVFALTVCPTARFVRTCGPILGFDSAAVRYVAAPSARSART